MEGTECCERAILPEKALREKLNTVIEDEFSKVALRNTIKYFKPHSENDCVGATIKVLEYSLTKKEVPKPYQTLLKEIRKDSPVSSWLPSYSQQDTRLLVTLLNQECNVLSDFGNVSKLTQAFPYLTRLMSELLTFHSTKFLPPHLTEFVFSLVNLRESFDIKAEKCAVKRTKPKPDHVSAPVEIYPNMPEHTVENVYKADDERDKTEDVSCSKAYNSKVDITGGLTHISCEHNIVKGFTALYKGESALQVLAPVVRRLPKRVKAKQRFFVYDNCCASHKSALRRFPHRVRHWTFVIDRTHSLS